MGVDEWQLESVRRDVRQTVDAVGREAVILPLLSVRDDRRAGFFKLAQRLENGLLIKRLQAAARAAFLLPRLDQGKRTRNATDRLRRNFHRAHFPPRSGNHEN